MSGSVQLGLWQRGLIGNWRSPVRYLAVTFNLLLIVEQFIEHPDELTAFRAPQKPMNGSDIGN